MARESQEAGFTQPSLFLPLHVCMLHVQVKKWKSQSQGVSLFHNSAEKTTPDRDRGALAREVQDSRALVKQRGLCKGLQLSGGIPHEPRE